VEKKPYNSLLALLSGRFLSNLKSSRYLEAYFQGEWRGIDPPIQYMLWTYFDIACDVSVVHTNEGGLGDIDEQMVILISF
jgi:hypothetical protein